MTERVLWWGATAVIVGLGVTGIVHVSGTSREEFELPVSLLTTLVCGAIALGALALTARPRPLSWLGAALLLWTIASYALLQFAIWHSGFAERHERLVATVSVLALASALLATLAAQVRDAPVAVRSLALAAATAIAAAAGYGISLIFTSYPGSGETRTIEILSILAIVGFFATPFVQRALRRPPQRPRPSAKPVTPSPAP
jgi:hypothetical protein